jgi:hypothetical protein
MKIPVVSQRDTSHLSSPKPPTSSPKPPISSPKHNKGKHNNGKHNQGHQITFVHVVQPDFVQVRLPSGNIGFVPIQKNVGFVQVKNPVMCIDLNNQMFPH